jgi:hypothetical protein
MRSSNLYIISFILAAIVSCSEKDILPEEESQGTSFNLLLKTVLKSPDNSAEIITTYEYNSTGQLIETSNVSQTNGVSSPQKTVTAYYRTSSRIDSVVDVTTDTGIIKYKGRSFFRYDFAGKITNSVFIRVPGYSVNSQMGKDSSIYLYNGNQLIQRTDYRSDDNGPYTIIRDLFYTYDAAGNLVMLRSDYTNSSVDDIIQFTFDNKTNPVPVERSISLWTPAFYHDYRFVNNALSKTAQTEDSYTYEYRYTSNNKPLYRKEKKVNSPAYGELYYYYD